MIYVKHRDLKLMKYYNSSSDKRGNIAPKVIRILNLTVASGFSVGTRL